MRWKDDVTKSIYRRTNHLNKHQLKVHAGAGQHLQK
jgi:hypothetical protein